MKPRTIDTTAANNAKRRHTTSTNRHSSHSTHQTPPSGRQGFGEYGSANNNDLYARTMLRLRVCIGLLSALLLASIAHAVTDGLTLGGVFALTLTTLLLLAALGLWRVGSRRQPDNDR
jgi:ABC-type nickel/cobalt efflux system permease component RcnA